MASRKRKQHHILEYKSAAEPRAVWSVTAPRVAIGLALAVALLTALWLARKRLERMDATGTGGGSGIASSAAPANDDSQVHAEYAGSASCQQCHAAAYEKWGGSHHGLAERLPSAELDQAAFDPPRSFDHGSQPTSVRIGEGGRYEVTAVGLSGKPETMKVERVIGHDPLRQFLVTDPKRPDRLQALEASYDPHKNAWFNVYGTEDRKPGEWGHWTGRGMNWNSMCASCHNTRVRKNYDPASDTYRTTMAERTVSCESCHGPMKAHVEWQVDYQKTRPPAGSPKKDPTVQRFTKEQTFDTCATCHARQAELTGDFVPGHSYFDHYSLATVDETDVFYPDGQVRDEAYEVSAFMGSRMHAAGVRCADCHDPHTAETLLPGNALCMKCHTAKTGDFPTAPLIDPAAHSHHPVGTSGHQCVGCHMPITTYMQRHGRHDHGFTVPDPLLTKELGIPNACNRCHTDRDADWAAGQIKEWYGDKTDAPNRKAARDRTRAIAAQRKPNPQADASSRDRLIGILLDDAQQPYWRAVAAGLLEPHLSHRPAVDALKHGLKDHLPLVRSAAVRALAPAAAENQDVASALRQVLDDPSRSVRLGAAAPLSPVLDPNSRAYRELRRELDHRADQPEGRLSRGWFHRARGDLQAALADYQKAVEFSGGEAPAHFQLATLYTQLKRYDDTVKHLQAACQREPNHAGYWMHLGLVQQDLARFPEAITALKRVAELEPQNAEAHYHLGMAYDANNQPLEAMTALHRAEQINRAEPAIPYARATILLRLKRVDDARAAARRALEIQPDYDPARQLLHSLP